MSDSHQPAAAAAAGRPWDARIARRLVAPLVDTSITPNHLTTLRLAVGLAGVATFLVGTYLATNIAALLIILSNFLDHADGELARASGKGSRFGHLYDLACDALVTILQFVAMGIGVAGQSDMLGMPPALLGAVAGVSVAVIFFLRMRLEEMFGKPATQQGFWAGFETEDILYLLPLVTLFDGVTGYLTAAAVGAPLFAVFVIIDYRRLVRRARPLTAGRTTGAGLT